MPTNNNANYLSSIVYAVQKNDDLIVSDNILIRNGNVRLTNYEYTYNKKKQNFASKYTCPVVLANYYKLNDFIENKKSDAKYSTGTIYLENRSIDKPSVNISKNQGAIDIVSLTRSICRQEIEYALWNYSQKLNDNGININPNNLRLNWFHFTTIPTISKDEITIYGFPPGTDDSEFESNSISERDIQLFNSINI